jgi:ABC-type branched-subunit amino acid transport system ATPase component
MTGALPLILADQRLAERRGIKAVIFGKNGIGKTSRLAELANALPPIVFLPLDSEDGSPEPEVRS